MTLVVDASVLTEVVIGSPTGVRARKQIEPHAGRLHIPDLAIVESISALRQLVRSSRLAPSLADMALGDLLVFPARRWMAGRLSRRVWALRDVLTAYDAVYVALAEALEATLLTADHRLARGAAAAVCDIETVVEAQPQPETDGPEAGS